ncbi:hypothetical protein [Saccharothrix luteola]|uniref:hypothetical protein n=1 Tax=Saccharothrix luteola TaxID=2893018 RepID=UPI001E34F80C|nr:hypothetical protein [Saccharothrix luteola]MCC8249690.1 hypothetical protein [Saccharothrix luteola]
MACGRLGTAMLTVGALLPPIIVLIGSRLPPIYPALGVLGWTFAAIGVVQVFIAASVLRGARRHVTGEHLDVHGALTTRRSLAVVWGCGLFSTVFSAIALWLGLSTAAEGQAGLVHHSAAAWAVPALALVPGASTGVAFFAGRRLFAPPVSAR